MHPDATRVVYDNHPYLVVEGRDPRRPAVHGPFQPGTEPGIAACSDGNEVTDEGLRATVLSLRPISPDVPPHTDSLAGRE